MLRDALKMGTRLISGANTYQIERVLGQGTFGITYLATTTTKAKAVISGGLGEIEEEGEVIIKVAIKEFFMNDLNKRSSDGSNVEESSSQLIQDYRKKFRREAENLSHLNHTNIVKVLEVFDANNTTYYAMRYIKGQSLDEYISIKGKLNEEEALRIIRPIAEALQYMHDNKMLHLDLKPKNIMLDKNLKPYLIDFGLSKQYDDNGEPESSTTIGLGTPGYAPIEQANFKQDGTFPATLDVYALGATLYKMLTGKTPPVASDVLLYGVNSLPISLSANTRLAIIEAMNPKKTDRLQSVSAFMNVLKGVDNEESTLIEDVVIDDETTVKVEDVQSGEVEVPTKKSVFPKSFLYGLVACIVAAIVCIFMFTNKEASDDKIQIGDFSGQVEETLPPVLQSLINNMVYVEGGTFTMGATPEQGSEAESDEKPAHQVTLSAFSIGKYEVTQEEWEAVMGTNPSYYKGAKKPISYISWDDCQKFISKLNNLTGRDFRLPTEAEWEYSARSGNKNQDYKYVGGDNIGNVAWYGGNSGFSTHDVGTKTPNELGLYDMSGNVFEWCQDWYDDSYYSSSPTLNPKGPSMGSERVYRGGSGGSVGECRVSSRNYDSPNHCHIFLGFRLAL